MKHLFSFVIILFWCSSLKTQTVNDECPAATLLEDVESWCSDPNAFSNEGATESAIVKPTCFPETEGDVWFRFLAIGTDLNVRVIGFVPNTPGGSLRNPQVAIYQGSCEDLTQIGCSSDAVGDEIVELLLDDIVVGSEYWIRVSARNNNKGTFQLCVNSFNGVPSPNSDCQTGVILCDKSPFTVDYLTGSGSVQDEIDESCLDHYNDPLYSSNSEFSSAWYKWTARNTGSLSFTITPNNPSDDIDFAIFELPNGINDCSDKILLRCMASGENVGEEFEEWEICTGPTGLRLNEDDDTENPGCQPGNNNFVEAIMMEAGMSYALIINNFSQTGHGFSIDFGGTGEFIGPEVDFSTDDADGTICFGDPVLFFDQSSYGEIGIESWTWNFGQFAIPSTSSSPGPHIVTYQTPGIKSIALTVEAANGCRITEIGQIIVEEAFDISALVTPITCPESRNGSIELDIYSGSPVTAIQWNNGRRGNRIQDLGPGDYSVTITNFNGCETTLDFNLIAPPPLQIQDILTRPSCGGVPDGSIELIVEAQSSPVVYNWNDGNGFVPSNALRNIPAGVYPVTLQDANGCLTEETVLLGEINLSLLDGYEPVSMPSCAGYSDGSIELRLSGGIEPYQFDWPPLYDNLVSENILNGIGAGSFIIRIVDSIGCQGFMELDVDEPPPLTLRLDTSDISCWGASDGRLTGLPEGGTGSYSFNWSTGDNEVIIDGLSAGNYTLSVTDANNCMEVAQGRIQEPPQLFIELDSIQNVSCFEGMDGEIAVFGVGGSPGYEFGIGDRDYEITSQFQALTAGSYEVFIRDSRDCKTSILVEIDQPGPLLVEAFGDTVIDLGFTTVLHSNHFPPDRLVTYNWDPGGTIHCSDCTDPVARPLQTTTYLVSVVDLNGCLATDTVHVQVTSHRPVYIPNSFTPNHDGVNDQFFVYGGVAADFVESLRIFDRWGEKVYEGFNLPINDELYGWDGTFNGEVLNPGVFVYVADVVFIDGSTLTFEGDVTLVR